MINERGDVVEQPHSETLNNHELSRERIEAYVQGCEELAVRLDTTIQRVIEAKRKPLILIPSRGAIPIFLLARKILNQTDPERSYFSPRNVNYYPNGVFEFLEGSQPITHKEDSKVDVLLFPFTADVSSEGDEEWLAKKLRASCARSVVSLVGDKNANWYDLDWYRFLMKKLTPQANGEEILDPEKILKSLDEIPKDNNYQVILIDTVISGRAATNIIDAFQNLGITEVIPLLAVDSRNGGHLDAQREAFIRNETPWELIDEKGPFVNFPLITEDKGAALLGAAAFNFANFNNRNVFRRVNPQLFNELFLPQSCVWALPPSTERGRHLKVFQNFLDVAWQIYQKRGVSNEEMEKLQRESRAFTKTHMAPPISELQAFAQVNKDTKAKETSSHIISITLSEKQADRWVHEFEATLTDRKSSESSAA